MALTPAERMKRYRERLKNNAEKYEEQRKKQLERVKRRKTKICEMTVEEKQKQREIWQKHKKAQRQRDKKKKKYVKANQRSENGEKKQECVSKVRYLIKKCNNLNTNCKSYTKLLNNVRTANERIKKRFQRFKLQANKKINVLESTVNKMKAREEYLEHALRKTYQNAITQAEKRILKSIVTNAQKKTFVAKLLGLSGIPKTRIPGKRNTDTNKEITYFFTRDDVSRITAGKKECRTKNKEKVQIRYLLDTLQNLYKKYKGDGGKYRFSTFHKHKPFYVLSPHLAARNTCLCIKHSNFNFKFVMLKKNGVLPQKDIEEVLTTVSCDTKSYLCMYGNCRTCKNLSVQHDVQNLTKEITWHQWERVDHQYSKENKIVTTKKTVKSTKRGTVNDLLTQFKSDIPKFKKHYYNVFHQQEQYRRLIRDLNKNEAIIICDFSENYETKMAEEVQSLHFGASKSQVALHTGMVYWHDVAMSFCSVSANSSHQPPAIWAHLAPVIKLIKEKSPNVSIIHFFSDGPSSQYRQKHNFFLHSVFTKKYDFQYSTWSFFEAGHGKNVADGIGGSIKRTLDKRVCLGRDVTSALDAFNLLEESMKVVKIFYISDNDVQEVKSVLPSNVITLKGTMQVHQIVTDEEHVVLYRDLSCFCGTRRRVCKCYSPKKHHLQTVSSEQYINYLIEVDSETSKITNTKPKSNDKNYDFDEELRIDYNEDDDKIFQDYDIDYLLDEFIVTNNENSDAKNVSMDLTGDEIILQPRQTHTITNDASIGITMTNLEEPNISKIDLTLFDEYGHEPKRKKCNYYTHTTQQSNKENSDLVSNSSININPKPCSYTSSSSMKDTAKTTVMKSAKIIVKRRFQCENCSVALVLNRIAKCMCCKKWLCWDCSSGQIYRDYICDTCLLGDDMK